MAMNRNGRSKARLFRKVRKITGRSCDLEEVARDDAIEIVDARARDPGWTACLLRTEHFGLISCQPNQNPGRRRFSIAHELAHFHIPTHRTKSAFRPCDASDLEATEGYGAEQEWEANSFAAYLLMPRKHFGQDFQGVPISFKMARELADAYDVSITAAARRMVELTSEHCALVATEARRVTWQDRNEYYWRMATKGQKIRPETYAAGVYDGAAPNPTPEEIDSGAWIIDGLDEDLLLVESTHHVPSQEQVLSLLWAPEYEEGIR